MSSHASRYGLYLSVVVNIFLVTIVLGVFQVPVGEPTGHVQNAAGSVILNGTMDLLVGQYEIRPIDSSYNSGGHPSYAMPASRIEDDSVDFDPRIAKEMGSDPARCVFIRVTAFLSQANAPVEWDSIGCEEERRVVFVHEDLLGEWYAAWMTDRPTLMGPGYSFGIHAGSPIEQDITGVFLSTVGYANSTESSVSRELIEYEGEIRWEYFPAVSWSRSDWRSS